MDFLNVRGLSVVFLTMSLMLPATASATVVAPPTGTLVGNVTCGADELTPAPHIVVAAEGLSLRTTTDGSGKFTLLNVPAGQTLTIDAMADPETSFVASRSNIVVQAGETLDVGSMDLAICQPVAPAPIQDEGPADNPNDTAAA